MYKYTVKVTQKNWLTSDKEYIVTVYSDYSDKPSEREIKQALVEKYGDYPGGMIELRYYKEG